MVSLNFHNPKSLFAAAAGCGFGVMQGILAELADVSSS